MDTARYGLAIALTKGGQFDEARDILAPLLQKAPNDITYNLAQISLDSAANRLPATEQRVSRLLELYPNNYPVNQARIDLLLKQRKIPAAEQALNDLLKRRMKDPDVWYQVAEVRGLSGNTIGLHQARAEYFALVGDFNQAIEQLDFAKRRAANNFQMASRIDARQKELIEEKRMTEEMLRG
ncbi:Beta-barrel assembly-enhancing protease [Pseudomonas sp. Bi70]|nr:Beta-barrel assembly-enhancing protease [Pseudomonas sp. Bi70]